MKTLLKELIEILWLVKIVLENFNELLVGPIKWHDWQKRHRQIRMDEWFI